MLLRQVQTRQHANHVEVGRRLFEHLLQYPLRVLAGPRRNQHVGHGQHLLPGAVGRRPYDAFDNFPGFRTLGIH